MTIYVAHASNFDFHKELYEPIRQASFNKKHTIILPHEDSQKQYNSKDLMKTCNLVIAEVSYPSTGQGIELGWADLNKVRIICFYKTGTKPSGAIKVVSNTVIEYTDSQDLMKKIEENL